MEVRVIGFQLTACFIILAGTCSAAWNPWEPSPAIPPACELQLETNPFRLAGVLAVSAYRHTVSPLLPGRCQFRPSCSGFALQALSERGLLNGAIMSAERIMRCHGFAAFAGYRLLPEDGLLEDPLDKNPSPLPWLSFLGL